MNEMIPNGMRRFLRGEEGIASVEFALIAPILAFALIAAIDISFAISQRMALKSTAGTGAAALIQGRGVDDARSILTAMAAQNFSSGGGLVKNLATNIDECLCPCAGFPDLDAQCGGSTTGRLYSVSASASYNGIFLPSPYLGISEIPLESRIIVRTDD